MSYTLTKGPQNKEQKIKAESDRAWHVLEDNIKKSNTVSCFVPACLLGQGAYIYLLLAFVASHVPVSIVNSPSPSPPLHPFLLLKRALSHLSLSRTSFHLD
jgi:hypothetical protein